MSEPPTDPLDAIRKELKRLEEDCIFSSKAHFNASRRWSHYHYWLGVPAVVLSAAAGTAFFKDLPDLAGAMASTVAVLTALSTFLKPSDRSAAHKTSGDQYLTLRNDSRVFREIGMSMACDTQAALEQMDGFSKRRNELNQGAYQFSRGDFEKARKGIEQGEALHEVDGGGPHVRS
ncbi:SLATT domain-containing protein [Phenylobacterium sp. LH3H17]|uniref:SLATT domain-containing protein n=1 Tax=Phenylobacterium sp. LH3H17 TaxID=2903901 RepID=UPI0020C93B7A|nr:SLATT domain-containing protein [Phenylobacterium sp. LH3H17]UTP38176.1 SLATT domain-containing protein [Phenylobacterium sp. LH3H17]